MEVVDFPIKGPKLIKLKTFHDERGFFVERFNAVKFKELGLPADFKQDNFSHSKFGVIRGLHFQHTPPQGKLVSCTNGEILDVAVDIRRHSPTFGHHIAITLNSAAPALLWIPAGFAHGFCVTSKGGADVLYKVDNVWNSSGEGCIAWNDANIGIKWPNSNPIISAKDALGKPLKECSNYFNEN